MLRRRASLGGASQNQFRSEIGGSRAHLRQKLHMDQPSVFLFRHMDGKQTWMALVRQLGLLDATLRQIR